VSAKPHTEVEKIRGEIERTRDELEWLESSRVPRDELKARAAERIRAAAAEFDGDLKLHQLAAPQGLRSALLTLTVPGNQVTVNEIDLAPVVGWLLGTDKLIDLVHARVDALDYRPGPPMGERPARLAELRTELRTLEEREEAMIVSAEAAGVPIPRRADADPAVVLCYNPDGDMAEGIKFASAQLAPQGAVSAERPAAPVAAPPAPTYAGHQSGPTGPAASARSPMNVASRMRR
jgi:hypothetical protein